MLKRTGWVVVVAILSLPLFAVVGNAGSSGSSVREPAFDSSRSAMSGAGEVGAAQHGGNDLHLPPVQQNIELVGKLEVNTPAAFRWDPTPNPDVPDPNQPQVVPGQIADVAVFKGAAYLDSWSEPTCKRGGFFSVDISNPASPQQLAFVPALPDTYHGEGAQARTINTAAFNGDMLAVNNEPCGPNGVGGFDLYDVSDPAHPQILVQGMGDQSPDEPPAGQDEVGFADTTQDPSEVPNSAHSIFIWQEAGKAYAVIVDNTELHDVDIFDITNPRAPEFIADVDVIALADAEGLDVVGNSANGDNVFHHDMVVKKINDIQTMLVSYWDAGYIKLNVQDPTNPTILGDSDFGTQDPLVEDPSTGEGFAPPEGNGHEGEFSFDNKFVLAADEDFSAYRAGVFSIDTGPNADQYDSQVVPGGAGPSILPDRTLNGPVVYGGYGCNKSTPVPQRSTFNLNLAAGEEAILAVQRGPAFDPDEDYDNDGDTNNDGDDACFPGEKAANAIDAGWDGVVIGNRHQASGDAADDSVNCGSGAFPGPIVAVCVSHETIHRIFDDPPTYGVPVDDDQELAALGTVGERVTATSKFDGWGYTHLFRNDGSELVPVDHFAIDEALDERFGGGNFGALSVHEFATDPTEYLAYSAYYAGGMRVIRFGNNGMEQVGAFIDQGGNDFWGVEQFTTPQGDRLFAGSDRDYGLYLFRYTGPGAAQKPVCSNNTTLVPFKGSASVPLTCSDANANPLHESVLSAPSNGSLSGDADSGAVTYTHSGGSLGPAGSFTFKANDGAADSNVATASLVTVPGNAGPCANPFAGSARRDVIIGTRFGDRIAGEGGSDVLEGRAASDCLLAGSGADEVRGGAGNDSARGGSGDDRLFGGGGRDVLRGRSGDDLLKGGSGRNRLSGGPGNDRIRARNGAVDRIRCGRGFDRVRADRGDRVSRGCERVRRIGR
jgi:Ca2+-binding RTX toxin-like protein